MEDLFKGIQNTPIPTILIVVGLFILILGFVTKIGGIIEVSPERKVLAIPIGLFVLTIGLILNFSTVSDPSLSSPVSAPSPSSPILNPPPSSSISTPPPSSQVQSIPPSSQVQSIGWIRLGATRNTSGFATTEEALVATSQPITISPMRVPEINDQVVVITGVNVRTDYPKPPNYELQDKLSVFMPSQKIVILEIKTFVDQSASPDYTIVWAKVGVP